MTTIEIVNETLNLGKTRFETFDELIGEVEDLKLGKIMEKNSGNSFDINILQKKYLG